MDVNPLVGLDRAGQTDAHRDEGGGRVVKFNPATYSRLDEFVLRLLRLGPLRSDRHGYAGTSTW